MSQTSVKSRKVPLLRAVSIDKALLTLWENTEWKAKLHSVYANAVNVVDTNHNLVIITTANERNGPYRIITDNHTSLSDMEIFPGDDVAISESTLWLASKEITVTLKGARLWSENFIKPSSISAAKIAGNISESIKYLICNSKNDEQRIFCSYPGRFDFLRRKDADSESQGFESEGIVSTRLTEKLSSNINEIIQGFELGRTDRIKQSIMNLAGSGFGLTPSGDDIILGFINALHFLNNSLTGKDTMITDILEWFNDFIRKNADKTTFISSKFLKWASLGRMSEDVNLLCRLMIEGNESDIVRIGKSFLSMGSSSGKFIMLGVTTGINGIIVQKSNNMEEREEIWSQKILL